MTARSHCLATRGDIEPIQPRTMPATTHAGDPRFIVNASPPRAQNRKITTATKLSEPGTGTTVVPLVVITAMLLGDGLQFPADVSGGEAACRRVSQRASDDGAKLRLAGG